PSRNTRKSASECSCDSHIGMHRRDRSVAGNPQTVDVFGPRIPYMKGRPGPMSEPHIRSADRMKRDVSADGGGALFRTLMRLWPYIWPSDRRDLQWRVVWSTVLLFGAKLATVAVPFTFKWAVDALSGQGSAPVGADSWLVWVFAAPVA